MSSCETFLRVSSRLFLEGSVTDCPVGFPKAWQATRPSVSGKPAGEYPPPSTHRLFSSGHATGTCEGKQPTAGREWRQFFRPSTFERPPQDSRDLKRLPQARPAFPQIFLHRLPRHRRPSRPRARADRRQQSRAGEGIDKRQRIAGGVNLAAGLECLPVLEWPCGKPLSNSAAKARAARTTPDNASRFRRIRNRTVTESSPARARKHSSAPPRWR